MLVTMSWEDTFQSWAKPPSETEQTKCDNAERAIHKAIYASAALKDLNIRVFRQGSYRNRTNVRFDSDVDVCVLCPKTFFYDLPKGTSPGDFGIIPATYQYSEYKNDVESALIAHFGSAAVTRGHKAFDIHENTYRVDADVVACFEHRRYGYRSDGTYYHLSGTELRPDNGGQVINWPDQNYNNGVAKNNTTAKRFKAVVRILKRLRNEMEEEGIAAVQPIPGYLIECLVWNVPNERFGYDILTADVRSALVHLFNNTIKLEDCKEWGEINELKYLFRASQRWTLEQTHSFLSAAWNYLGFN